MNIALLSPAQMIFAASATPIAVDMAISDDHARFLLTLVSVVVAVAGALAWVDSRVEKGRKRNAELILELKEDLKEVHQTIRNVEMNGCAQRCTDPTHRHTPVPRFVIDAEK